MSTSPELRPAVLAVIDLDDTLMPTTAAWGNFAVACEGAGVAKVAVIDEAKVASEQAGESFAALRFVRTLIDEIPDVDRRIEQLAALGRATQNFVAAAASHPVYPRFLYPDAVSFLDSLVRRNQPFMILTTGHEPGQALKLKASKLDQHPHAIIPRSDKATIIHSWFNRKSGTFRVPEGMFARRPSWLGRVAIDKVALFEDKVSAVTPAPGMQQFTQEGQSLEDAGLLVSYLMRRPDQVLRPSQQGERPPHVTVLSSFADFDMGTLDRVA